MFAGQLDRLAAVAGLRDDVVAAEFAHQGGQPLAGERFVVDEQDLHAASMPHPRGPVGAAVKRVSSQPARSRISSAQTLCGIG